MNREVRNTITSSMWDAVHSNTAQSAVRLARFRILMGKVPALEMIKWVIRDETS